jgi:hypothetical protein
VTRAHSLLWKDTTANSAGPASLDESDGLCGHYPWRLLRCTVALRVVGQRQSSEAGAIAIEEIEVCVKCHPPCGTYAVIMLLLPSSQTESRKAPRSGAGR